MKHSSQIIIALIGVAIASVAVYFASPVFVFIGSIVFLSNVIEYVYLLLTKPTNTNEPGCGCGVSAFVCVAIGVLCIFMNGNRYINELGTIRHRYEDCTHVKMYKVSKVGALICGCFEDCDVCEKRFVKEKMKIKEKAMKEKQKQDLQFVQEHINELEKVKKLIEKGDYDIDVDDYYFRYEIEEEIDEAIEERNDLFFESLAR